MNEQENKGLLSKEDGKIVLEQLEKLITMLNTWRKQLPENMGSYRNDNAMPTEIDQILDTQVALEDSAVEIWERLRKDIAPAAHWSQSQQKFIFDA